MKRFYYKAKDKNGNVVTGEVEASDESHAAKLIRSRELIVIWIKPTHESLLGFFKKFKDKIKSKEITSFSRQLATMVNAGLPITEALLILRAQSKGAMQEMVARILADVEGGESLSTAISRYPKSFSPTFIALVRSGEVGGVMDQVLGRLADNLEKNEEFKGKIKGALIYPIVIVVGMIAVAVIMMIFVIPKMMSLYTEMDVELPGPTKILLGVSGFVVKFWPLTLAILIGGIYAFSVYRKTEKGRLKTDELLLKIPVYGEFQRQVILTEITRTLSLMVGSGVSILEGLNITAGIVNNVVISMALKDAAKMVEKGFPVSYAFAKHPEAFPFILTQMIAVGEETGKMEEVLTKISHVFEVESDEKVKALTSAIEPIVMIILGIGVGFLVIAIILPIYSLTSAF